MSLRTFHIIFIVCSILVSIGFGYWAIRNLHHWTAVGSFALAVGLIFYEIKFLKKVSA